MVIRYQPDRGHFIAVDCDPQAGCEQAGRRPALVVSPLNFNVATGLIWAFPITNQIKGSPFEVPLPRGMAVTGAILVSHLKSFDWLSRNVTFIGVAPLQLSDEAVARAAAIMGV